MVVGNQPDGRALFALWLRRHREARDLSPEVLSEQLGSGSSPEAVLAWEAGKVRPSRRMAERLARIFDVPYDEYPAFALFAISDLDAPDGNLSDDVIANSELDPDAPWRAQLQPPSNLPTLLTTFVGREADVARVAEFLRKPGIRLLTLLGPPGIGKTRLSIESARHLLTDGDYEDGVFFVPLAALTDGAGIALAIASTLGVKESASRPAAEVLVDFLRDKRLLLVLDNMEQINDVSTPLADLLSSAPRIQIVVTSRIVLSIYGEHVWRVPALPVPPSNAQITADILAHSEAADLFVQRARSVYSDFVVDDITAPVIAEICRKLDGLPLAIELAAARVNILKPQSLLARLDSRLGVLTGGAQNLPPRQRTLRGAIDWSYNLLDGAEKMAYRRLAVFVGGLTLEAAERVVDEGLRVLDLVSSLVDKSLLKQEDGPDDQTRFAMLETIREYGLERLRESGEENEVRRAHALAMVALAEEAEPHMTTGGRDPWLRKLDVDLDNIRAALNWSLGEGGDAEVGLQLAGGLHWFWYFRGYIIEGRRWLENALQIVGESTLRSLLARALHATAHFALEHGDFEVAFQHIAVSVQIWRELGNERELAFALCTLGVILELQGHRSAGLPPLNESVAILREQGDDWHLALALERMADVITWQDDFDTSARLYQESLDLFRRLNDQRFVANELTWLGGIFLSADNYTQAFLHLEQALAIQASLGDKRVLAFVLNCLGLCYLRKGESDKARTHFHTALTIFTELGMKTDVNRTLRYLAYLCEKIGDHRQAQLVLAQYLDNTRGLGDERSSIMSFLAAACLGIRFGASDIGTKVLSFINSSGKPLFHIDRAQYADGLTATKRATGKNRARWDALWADGSRMTFERAQQAAQEIAQFLQSEALTKLSGNPSFGTKVLEGRPLSKREIELLRLLAVGLSNEQIALNLSLSPNTVRAHLYSIYSKINVRSRTAAARFAFENHLL